ncbi:MAG: LLM class F420-dependent oxidoreductase [SAR202 cluster bacterium]|nr:LLM class F420-dependent oxidoreductase [SAR202 cluster bacterium]
MKFGICLPTNKGITDFRALISIAPKAEELGFDSVWVSDHLFNIGYIAKGLGNRPYYDPMTVLTYAAAITSKVKLGTSVLVLPYHHPARLAKVAATLDQASAGRVVLGLGVGRIKEEYDAIGATFERRGAQANEMLRAMKALWTQEKPEFHGKFYNFSDAYFSPKPLQKPHPPLWIGGMSESAMKRAARYGDAWHPNSLTPDQVRQGLEFVRREASKLGRDGKMPATMLITWDPANKTGPTAESASLSGSPVDVIKRVKEYQAAGVTEFAIGIPVDDPLVMQRHMVRFANEVLPSFK